MENNHTGLLYEFLIQLGVENNNEHLQYVIEISVFVTLICACIVLGHLLEETRWINESITALILGCCTGFVVLITTGWTSSHILEFNEELFFIYLLPPIIFNAGFQVKKKQFFQNFAAIMLYGIVGVFISFAIISAGCAFMFPKLNIGNLEMRDYLALGTIFSATDSVCTLQVTAEYPKSRFTLWCFVLSFMIRQGLIWDSHSLEVLNQNDTPLLYSLVFGEGVVNDATSIVLFRAVQKFDITSMSSMTAVHILGDFLYLFFTSTVLGVSTGLLSAYIIKTLYFGRHSTDREIAIMALMAYLSYMIAELFYLSGILTVFFCGIVMSHYTWHNVTERSRVTTRHAFATMSFIAETFIFLYVGMDTLDANKWKTADTSASFCAFGVIMLLVFIGRAAFVFPLSALSNYARRTPGTKINARKQFIIWWAGLIRGAVSIALAFNQFTISGKTMNAENATVISSTIMMVLFSTVVFGIMTKPLIALILPHNLSYASENSETSSPKVEDLDTDIQNPFLANGEHEDGSVVVYGLLRRSSLSMLLHAPTSTIHKLWRYFDNSYMRPVFGGRGFVPCVPGSPSRGDVDGPLENPFIA